MFHCRSILIFNHWCPLSLKRHNNTVRNACKNGITDFFKITTPEYAATKLSVCERKDRKISSVKVRQYESVRFMILFQASLRVICVVLDRVDVRFSRLVLPDCVVATSINNSSSYLWRLNLFYH